MESTLAWQPDGSPYSPLYGDVYHSHGGALAQARRVFLAGCGLPAAWQDRAVCRVLETGFGLGLNFLTTWAAWQADPRRCAQLRYLCVEAHPVTADDLLRGLRALQAVHAEEAILLPRMQAQAEELARAWSRLHPGVQDWDLDGGRLRLTLGVGEVREMLPELQGPVDAVYLDGFSPARNPAMWSTGVMQDVARLCRPGTRLASWCVAGEVRARLQQAGFEVCKQPGLPPKRHRLEARYLGAADATQGAGPA
jgi:tRNA 5-methylaminomethyl-2-thiouridine biosynthesis bifunctional protein